MKSLHIVFLVLGIVFLVFGGITLTFCYDQSRKEIQPESAEIFDLSSFKGKIVEVEDISPSDSTINSSLEEALNWDEDSILRFGTLSRVSGNVFIEISNSGGNYANWAFTPNPWPDSNMHLPGRVKFDETSRKLIVEPRPIYDIIAIASFILIILGLTFVIRSLLSLSNHIVKFE